MTILSYLSRIRLEPVLPLLPALQKQRNEEDWELKGQLLILASNALVAFNTLPEEQEASQLQERKREIDAHWLCSRRVVSFSEQ